MWANDGGDKVTRDELRATTNATAVLNRSWTGTTVKAFGAKNEVASFNLVLESSTTSVPQVAVSLPALSGPGGATIQSQAATGNGVFDWVNRPIELFYVKYLQIKGLSRLSYETYDERHIPKRMRRPYTGQGIGSGVWADRPDHDKFYPDIAIPLELQPTFTVAASSNQSIWVDVYVPKTAVAGVYTGSIEIRESGVLTRQIPVELTVRNFTLPDSPSSKSMVFVGYGDLGLRYTGTTYPNSGSAQDAALKRVRDRHFQIAHRHRLSMIDSNNGASAWSTDAPRAEWVPRLSGQLFTPANGYAGPGESVGNGVFSIGTYGSWSWRATGTETDMRNHTNNWESWFATNSPATERFLYLIDESSNYTQTEQWASWVANNPGVGSNLRTFATVDLPAAISSVPSLDIAASWLDVGDTTLWGNALATSKAQGKKYYMYNGKRPAQGSFATEDDGVALRELAWAQHKKGVDRWFFWESTYYNDTQGGRGQTNVFQNAQTFGGATTMNASTGMAGWNSSNGDGVLFYPGTDTVYPAESYGVEGPFASLRMKHWRRGIQDVDYLTLAMAKNPARVNQLISQMVPKAFWEYGVSDPNDPTWVRTDISWSTNPDVWEAVRDELATIIETP